MGPARMHGGPGGFMRGGRGGPGGPGAWMAEKKRARDVGGTTRRLVSYVSRYPRGLATVAIFVAASTGFALLGPYLLGRAIDAYIVVGDLPGLVKIVLIMAGVYFVAALTTWLQTFIMVGVSQRALYQLRTDLFNNLQTLSLNFFDGRPHGELMSRLANDVENISNVLTHSATQLISSVLNTVGVVSIMMMMNWRLACVTFITIPLMFIVAKAVAKRTRIEFRSQQKALGALNGIIEETITGQKVVKAFGREAETIKQFDDANTEYRGYATRAQTLAGILPPIINFVNNFGFVIVAGAGSGFAVAGIATVGTVAAFVNYTRQFARPLNQIASLYNTVQSALAGAERVFEVIDETPQVSNEDDAIVLQRIEGHVVFQDVCFSYVKDTPVLKDITFEAHPGKTVALVGPTGAGKTTVVNLLTRFYDVESGKISIDGLDIRKATVDSLRRRLGIVLQDTFLFSSPVMENIRYGRLDATDSEVIEAATTANADTFIRRLPDGYQTMLSEDGSNLSQGQRQLVSIARAILADPAILILDEATSSVDTRTEIHIQEAMLRLMTGRTSIVIAHRLSTIQRADEILFIDNGQIVERGTHKDLLTRGGYYHRLYSSQFAGIA